MMAMNKKEMLELETARKDRDAARALSWPLGRVKTVSMEEVKVMRAVIKVSYSRPAPPEEITVLWGNNIHSQRVVPVGYDGFYWCWEYGRNHPPEKQSWGQSSPGDLYLTEYEATLGLIQKLQIKAGYDIATVITRLNSLKHQE